VPREAEEAFMLQETTKIYWKQPEIFSLHTGVLPLNHAVDIVRKWDASLHRRIAQSFDDKHKKLSKQLTFHCFLKFVIEILRQSIYDINIVKRPFTFSKNRFNCQIHLILKALCGVFYHP
jgi:hypothetical protein